MELMRVLLEDEYKWHNVSGVEVENLATVWIRQVVPEIVEFLNDDVHGRLARVLGLTPYQGAELLAVRKHLETTDAARRNDLLTRRPDSPVWKYIRKARQNHAAATLPDDDKIVEQVLKHHVRTPAGRVIGPDFHTAVRRQQILLLTDEVLKAVAYVLASKGLTLAAVADNQFALEISESQVTAGFLEQVKRLVLDAERRLLGRFAAPCQWDTTILW